MSDIGGAVQSVCMGLRCDGRFAQALEKCPDCGSRCVSLASLKLRGWVAMACGVVLLGIMGWVSWYVVPLLLAGGREVDGARFDGTAQDMQFVIGIFALVIAIGLGALANGVAMAIYGRRLRKIMLVMLVLAAILFAIGYLIRRGVIA